ncbi:hypothetical protein [Methyloversatilis sp.]|uniref:hypothetical protein n=1 Tax=Methyloversatilis sp. TaxID=2569862 RepID=UPI003F728ACF
MLQFDRHSATFPRLMPETFFESHAATALGKAEFSRVAAAHTVDLERCLESLLALLRAHHLNDAADALVRQVAIDRTRLDIPSITAAR